MADWNAIKNAAKSGTLAAELRRQFFSGDPINLTGLAKKANRENLKVNMEEIKAMMPKRKKGSKLKETMQKVGG